MRSANTLQKKRERTDMKKTIFAQDQVFWYLKRPQIECLRDNLSRRYRNYWWWHGRIICRASLC